jgi:hypothetical protein
MYKKYSDTLLRHFSEEVQQMQLIKQKNSLKGLRPKILLSDTVLKFTFPSLEYYSLYILH